MAGKDSMQISRSKRADEEEQFSSGKWVREISSSPKPAMASSESYGRRFLSFGPHHNRERDHLSGNVGRRCFSTSEISMGASLSNGMAGRAIDSGQQRKLNTMDSMKIIAGAFTSCFIPCGTKHEGSVSLEQHHRPMDALAPLQNADARYSRMISCNSWQFKSHNYKVTDEAPWPRSQEFSYSEIATATDNFSPAYQIGQGHFSTVYVGRLYDGTILAIKRAKKAPYNNRSSAEFKSEIRALAKVEHLNLVRFLGYVDTEGERMVVIEYVNNGTLREHLDGSRGIGLQLAARLDIAIDVAHAVAYLHMYADHTLIHRDIKPSNILLTDKLRAKVADFGFAHFRPDDPDVTHVSTQIRGTPGYLDPEYLRTYHLTEKSDVYSFGVVLIELVTGRRPIERKRSREETITTEWVMKKLEEGDLDSTVDPKLRRNPASKEVVEQVLRLASKCLRPTGGARPSMKECAEVLWRIRKSYMESQPPPLLYSPPSAAHSRLSQN